MTENDINDNIDYSTSNVDKRKKKEFPRKAVMLLLAILIVSGSLYVYGKFQESLNPSDYEPSTKDPENPEETPGETQSGYVIDASYKASSDIVTSYAHGSVDNIVKLSDIVVPYLNVKSEDANAINKEIESLYKEFVDLYDYYSQEITEEQPYSNDYIKSSYTFTVNNDIVSILIKVNKSGGGSSEAEEYYTANYDLITNKRLSLSDLCSKYNVDYQKVIEQAKESIETSYDRAFGTINYTGEENVEEYKANNKSYFERQNREKTETAYVDANNKLTLITLIKHPFGGAGFYWDTTPLN